MGITDEELARRQNLLAQQQGRMYVQVTQLQIAVANLQGTLRQMVKVMEVLVDESLKAKAEVKAPNA